MSSLNKYFIDIHCHPTMKAYGWSYADNQTIGVQSTDIRNKTSMWKYDPPTVCDKILNDITTLTKFRQADFTSSELGEIGVLFVCLYPPEKGFFKNKLGDNLSDIPLNLVTGLGKRRIDFLQKNSDYFTDLDLEYSFLKMNENKPVKVNKADTTYQIISQFSDLPVNDVVKKLYVVITIEGAHCFYTKWDVTSSKNTDKEVLDNVVIVKNWKHKPLFISVAHHFYNGLCGHAISLDKTLNKILNQEYGSDFGISDLGIKVIHKLLEKPNRILIDVKHMNIKNRQTYYDMLKSDYTSENIPIVISHGAVNGYKDASGNTTFPDAPRLFCHGDINFFDDELVVLAKSGGLLGIQLDERRIASKEMLKWAGGKVLRRKILFNWSKLIWNQVEHVAKVLDKAKQPAWDNVCLGSDYDGIVNPIGGYWTLEDIKYLEENLLIHADNFLKTNSISQKITPEEVVYKFKSGNSLDFLKRNY